jgi:beta-glucanase (GH16 family)
MLLIRSSARISVVLWLGLFGIGVFTMHADWQLVGDDEFNGTSLNTNTWALANCGGEGWGNNELQIYTNDVSHAFVTNGYLAIRATATQNGTNYYIASARMVSIGFDQCSAELFAESDPLTLSGGALEFRARVPVGTGLWPAVWMFPVPDGGGDSNWTSPIYGSWPGSGEIDVLETGGQQGGYNSNVIDINGNHYTWNPVSDLTQWHVYRMNWLTNQMQFIVDGVTNGTFSAWTPPPGFSYPAPFNIPFLITMNLAIGGDYVGDPTPAQCAASLPAELDIDYVRIYQQVNPVLSESQTNGSFIVSWLPQQGTWVLEQSKACSNAWAQIPAAQYQTNQNQIFFIVPPPSTNNLFYRLIEQ